MRQATAQQREQQQQAVDELCVSAAALRAHWWKRGGGGPSGTLQSCLTLRAFAGARRVPVELQRASPATASRRAAPRGRPAVVRRPRAAASGATAPDAQRAGSAARTRRSLVRSARVGGRWRATPSWLATPATRTRTRTRVRRGPGLSLRLVLHLLRPSLHAETESEELSSGPTNRQRRPRRTAAKGAYREDESSGESSGPHRKKTRVVSRAGWCRSCPPALTHPNAAPFLLCAQRGARGASSSRAGSRPGSEPSAMESEEEMTSD